MIIMLISCLWALVLSCNAAPIKKHLVDMTYMFNNETLNYPLSVPYKMTLTPITFEDFDWIQLEEFKSGTHVGTHMDAPSHFIKGGINVDQIPIEQFSAPAAVIDITERANHIPDAEAVIDDLLQWESLTGQTLDGTIVFLNSGWGQYWSNHTAYFGNADNDHMNLHFPGLCPEAAKWLVDNRKIKAFGFDTLSADHGASTTFESHIHLLGHGVLIFENVANVDKIPIYGATVYAFPMKMGGASGAPTRIVATYPDVLFSSQSHLNADVRPDVEVTSDGEVTSSVEMTSDVEVTSH